MAKKIAVLVRDRQGEALRMAVGLILLDDQIDVFVLDRKIEETEDNTMNIETMRELEMNLFSTSPDNPGMTLITPDELGETLLAYDHVVPY